MGLLSWARGSAAAALIAALTPAVIVASAQPLRAATLVLGESPVSDSLLSITAPALPQPNPARPPSPARQPTSGRGDITLADSMIAQATIPEPLAIAPPAAVSATAAVSIPPSLPDRSIWPAATSPAFAIPPSVPRQLRYRVAAPAPQATASVPEGNVAWGLGAIALALYGRRRWAQRLE